MANKTRNYTKRFQHKSGNQEYSFRLHDRNWKWLWLLLLIPLLLLPIRCERTIKITTVDKESQEAVGSTKVTIDYMSHIPFFNGKFMYSNRETQTITTDVDGNGEFTRLKCSVFSYIFYCLSKASYRVEDNCYEADPNPNTSNFHYTRHKNVTLSPKTTTLTMEVIDAETRDPLADAAIAYEFLKSGKIHYDTVHSDASGKFSLQGVPQCGMLRFHPVTCYGYEDIDDMERTVASVMNIPDSTIITMTPLKQSFSYFVKNKFTHDPIPGATVNVTLTSKNGKVLRGQSTTNVDGKGRGAFEDAFILAKVDLKAYKKNYKDGSLEGDYSVEKFAKLPDSLRVVYLEPEPYMERFQNVDSISGEPIAGVTNYIQIEGIDGKDRQDEEMSNRDGIFYIKAMAGDHIDITSSHQYYETKNTTIAKFRKGEIIPMQPKCTSLNFRTVDGTTWNLLNDCGLLITTSDGRTHTPTNSGSGEFTVKDLLYSDYISVTASKQGYATNSTTINHAKVSELANASQQRRDIPLNIDLPPCNGGASNENNVNAGNVSAPQSFNMGKTSGTFELQYYTGNACPDEIEVYNHNPGETPSSSNRIWTSGMIITGENNRTARIPFSNGSVITVIVTTGPQSGSAWNYHVFCPN